MQRVMAQTEFFLCIKHMVHFLSESYLKNWTIKLQSAFLQNGKVMLKFRMLSIIFAISSKWFIVKFIYPFQEKLLKSDDEGER